MCAGNHHRGMMDRPTLTQHFHVIVFLTVSHYILNIYCYSFKIIENPKSSPNTTSYHIPLIFYDIYIYNSPRSLASSQYVFVQLLGNKICLKAQTSL